MLQPPDQPVIRCAHTRIVPIGELKPNPRNPNKHPAKQRALYARIILHQGVRKPLVISRRTGYIVTGHGLYETAVEQGWQALPIDEQDFATDADEWAHVLADNQLPQMAELDLDAAQLMLADISGADLAIDLTGFDSLHLAPPDLDPSAFEPVEAGTQSRLDKKSAPHKCPSCGHEF